MSRLHLPHADMEMIRALARRSAPDEICGLIAGWRRGADLFATRALPIPNVSPTPRTRFEMARPAMVRALFAFRDAGLEVVGIYHSHPFDPPEPSEVDIREATWPDVVYVIVGFAASACAQFGAWTIRDGRASAVAIYAM